MGTTVLEEKYPFLTKYFKAGINNPDRNIAHCILFYGTDLEAQYELALEIARLLNCTGDKSNECNCLNCNWIRANQNPAVLTISKVDNKDTNDSSKTVISIEQARNIKNSLLVTSEYHRVLIFCDKDKDGNICGLNETNFQEPTANALLKTFEEPPKRTTFFFLTNFFLYHKG
jgi:DNA polymerase III delta prime subunit